MKGARKQIRFERLPTDYSALCRVFLPRPIRDRVDLENVTEIADAMAGHKLSKDQSDYFEMLCQLIENYETEHVPKAKVSGTEALRYILEEHGMSGADLSRLLGAHRTLGPMILRGERKLTVDHVRTLSEHFKVSAELFLAA